MTFRIFGCEVKISIFFLALVALMLYIDRTGMMSLTLLAVVVHEAGHLIMMRCYSRSPVKIELRPAVMDIVDSGTIGSFGGEIAILLGGPVANLVAAGICILLYYTVYAQGVVLTIAVLQTGIAVFNMLPIYGLDGGSILYLVLEWVFGHKIAYYTVHVVSILVLAGMILAGLYLFLYASYNPTLLLTGCYLSFMTFLKMRH